MTDVSIIIPIHNPDNNVLKQIDDAIEDQFEFNGEIEVIKVDKGFGLAKSMNYGIKKAKHDIVVTLHQDCVPISNSWLTTLIYPLEVSDSGVIACTSDVLDAESGSCYTPLLDEKGCAYKKKVLEKVGYFDENTFENSGEDMDLYLKLVKMGKIAYPHCVVEHYHAGYLNPKGEKSIQNANTLGCLFRVHGFALPGWWKGLIKANPFNIEYCYWFYRGFFKKKQDWRKGQTLRLLIRNYFT